MNAYIRSLGSYVPARRMSNDELATIVETSDDWIVSHTGIRFRHIAAENEAASDLGLVACERALANAGVAPEELDLILLATSTPDYIGLPSTACIVQDRLGAKNAGAMDVVAACTGFVYGLATANAFIVSGSARNVLVVGAEVYSKIMDWTDRNTCVLFGDGAGAALVSAVSSDSPSRVIDSTLHSNGNGATALLRPAGGSRTPRPLDGLESRECYLKMDGRRVYVFAVQVLVETITELLERNDITIDDVAYIVPHQANVRIIDAAAKRLGIPNSKFFINIAEYANTSAASIPIALEELQASGALSRGDLVLTVGFGAGLTYGGNLIAW
ncbi:MAG: ketoacyl-ACP synthase III [Spirochaetaceae bacterium]|nr:MAG: ketoacyl-ACP synthase III [Spirochaetaceae bacterium]